MAEPKRLVILGGGFAGVYTARAALRAARKQRLNLEVHLVSRENYMVFQPMLGEVISGSVGLDDTVSPIRRLVPQAILHVRDVERIDLPNRIVECSPAFRPQMLMLHYDHLVVAMGSVTDFRKMTGLAAHAKPFKNLTDALALRNHVIRLLGEADTEINPQARKTMLTFVVAGGGFSGVEAMAELHDFVRRVVRSFPGIHMRDCRFILLHSRDRILPEMDESLALYAQKLLAKRGIELWLNRRLASATPSGAVLADGEVISTLTLVATVPSSANPVVEGLAAALGYTTRDKDSKDVPVERLPAESTLRLQGQENLWALGDCAQIPIAGQSLDGKQVFAPPTAQHAIREAEICGENIVNTLTGKPLRHFSFAGLGSLASLGHRRGIASVMGIRLSGFPAWFLWRTVYLMKMPGLDRKIRVGFSWFLDLFIAPDLVQLKVGNPQPGIHVEHYEAGQTVYEQNDVGDRVYVIISGEVEVWRHIGTDPDQRSVAKLAAGQYFGEFALMNRAPRSSTIRCTKPTDLLCITKRDFNALFEYLHEFAAEFRKTKELRQNELAKLAQAETTPTK